MVRALNHLFNEMDQDQDCVYKVYNVYSIRGNIDALCA